MGSEDIERLRQFGEQVKKKQEMPNRQPPLFAVDVTNVKTMISSMAQYLVRCGKRFRGKAAKIIHRLSTWLYLKREHLKMKSQQKKQRFMHSSQMQRVIVEHQKQWGNTAIIIRRRKTIPCFRTDDSFSNHQHHSPLAYYFHRIDGVEHHQLPVFTPQDSIWDFRFVPPSSIVSWVKKWVRKLKR